MVDGVTDKQHVAESNQWKQVVEIDSNQEWKEIQNQNRIFDSSYWTLFDELRWEVTKNSWMVEVHRGR